MFCTKELAKKFVWIKPLSCDANTLMEVKRLLQHENRICDGHSFCLFGSRKLESQRMMMDDSFDLEEAPMGLIKLRCRVHGQKRKPQMSQCWRGEVQSNWI